jgi:hypothetical protein
VQRPRRHPSPKLTGPHESEVTEHERKLEFLLTPGASSTGLVTKAVNNNSGSMIIRVDLTSQSLHHRSTAKTSAWRHF